MTDTWTPPTGPSAIFNPIPVLTMREASELLQEIALGYPVTADELVTATRIPRDAVVGGLAQLIRMGWVGYAADDEQENRFVAGYPPATPPTATLSTPPATTQQSTQPPTAA